MRTILHSDLNNFYASVECIFEPRLKTVPMIVVGDPELRHGIVLAKNEIAKKAGVKTGETIGSARQKCPQLEVVACHFERYFVYSQKVRAIYADYTDLIEPFGIDEAWLDITPSLKLYGGCEVIVEEIRARVKKELGLTVSIGVSFNKIFAKLGSDMKKPDGVTYISYENFRQSIWQLPVSELLFIGRATTKKLLKYSIMTIGDLANADENDLKYKLGKWGVILHTFANGWDVSPVRRMGESMPIKSIGNSNTSPADITTREQVMALVYVLSESVAARLREHHFMCSGVTLHVRDCLLESEEMQAQLDFPTSSATLIAAKIMEIFDTRYDWKLDIRSIGVRAINLVSEVRQESMIDEIQHAEKLERMERAIDKIRIKWGHNAIKRGIVYLGIGTENMNPREDNTVHPIGYTG